MSCGVDLSWASFPDLAFHGLAHLAIDPADASSLHDPVYVRRVAHRLDTERRTLPADAALLARLYDAEPEAAALQRLALAFDAVEPFVAALRDHVRRGSAAALLGDAGIATPGPLPELLALALHGEVEAGFLALRAEHLVPACEAAAPAFGAEWMRLARRHPPLGDVRIVLSAPLGSRGRLLHPGGGQPPRVHVGVPDPERGVPAEGPLLQAVHEAVLAVAMAVLPREESACRPDRAGWAGHAAAELTALCLGAALLRRDPLAAAHRAWLERLFPGGAADVRAGLVPGETDPPQRDLQAWLASGAALPRTHREAFREAADRLEIQPG